MKNLFKVLLVVFSLAFVACGGSKEGESNEAKKLKFAHGLTEDHPLHQAFIKFIEELEKESNGELTGEVFANGILGSSRAVLEQVQTGLVDGTTAGVNTLENFNSVYTPFSLPFVFDGQEHFYKVMDSAEMEGIYNATAGDGIIGLTYFDAGSRSFYTKDKPIMTPADLKGLKIRVMQSQTSIGMMKNLGGNPTPLPYGEIYTALQQGVIDGAENNPTALTIGKHGEVAKAYSFSEHMIMPDIFVISNKTWESLSDEHKVAVKNAAKAATEYHKEIWGEAIDKAMVDAEAMGVKFYYPEKDAFRELVAPLYEGHSEDINKVLEMIDSKR